MQRRYTCQYLPIPKQDDPSQGLPAHVIITVSCTSQERGGQAYGSQTVAHTDCGSALTAAEAGHHGLSAKGD